MSEPLSRVIDVSIKKCVFIVGIHKLCLSSFPFHSDSMTTNPVLELEKWRTVEFYKLNVWQET